MRDIEVKMKEKQASEIDQIIESGIKKRAQLAKEINENINA